jgi:hypothetical protein
MSISHLAVAIFRFNDFGSRAVIHCWPSPAQFFFVSGSIGSHDHIFVHSKTTYMFGNGACSSTRPEV